MKNLKKNFVAITIALLTITAYTYSTTLRAPEGKIFVGPPEICGEFIDYVEVRGPSGELIKVTVYCSSNINFTCVTLSPDGKELTFGELVQYVPIDYSQDYEIADDN